MNVASERASSLEPLHRLGAREALTLIAQRRISAAELAEAHLARIALRDPEIGAWAHHDADHVLGQARRAAPEARPLEGLLVGIKDNFDTVDLPTSYGSPIYAGHRPAADAAAVAILREHGAVIAGKTVSTEFAAWPVPRTRNPHRRERTPGGSSSGSAAAVADCMVPVALGTQTLGSVIRPASFCGIVGFKPSYGRISRVGIKPLSESLDTAGVLARDVRDAELVYRVLSSDEEAVPDPAAPPRVLACRGLTWEAADEDARAAFERFIEKMRPAIDIADWACPEPFTQLPAAARTIHDFELYRAFTFERTRAPQQLSRSFAEGLARASGRTAADYTQALAFGRACRSEFAACVPEHSVLVTLGAPGEAPVHESGTGDPVMNSGWTLLHAPCITIPVLTGATGMPIGLQIVAPRFRDADVLHAAAWLQRFAQAF